MAHSLIEVTNYDADVTVPDDGDTENAASVEVGFQALANRTKYLKAFSDLYNLAINHLAAFCTLLLSGNPAVDGFFDLAFDLNVGGFSISGGNVLHFPQAGYYEISVSMCVQYSDTHPIDALTSVQFVANDLSAGWVSAFGDGGEGGTTDIFHGFGRTIVHVTDPTASAYELSALFTILGGGTGTGTDLNGTNPSVHIRRIT